MNDYKQECKADNSVSAGQRVTHCGGLTWSLRETKLHFFSTQVKQRVSSSNMRVNGNITVLSYVSEKFNKLIQVHKTDFEWI